MELFRRENSRCWWYDFTIRGTRFRGSTKERNRTAAYAKAAVIFAELSSGKGYCTNQNPISRRVCSTVPELCRECQTGTKIPGLPP